MLRIVLAAIILLLSVTVTQAATCAVTVQDLDFGNVDTIGNTPAVTTANVAISCENVAEGTSTVTVCGNIGAGTGGESGGVRQAGGIGGGLKFTLSADGSVPWGSSGTPELGNPYEIDVPASGGSASGTAVLHGTVLSGQAAAAMGDYSSSFTGTDVAFKYAEGSLDCSAPAGAADASGGSFAVNAMVPANCLLQTHDLDFGTTGLIGHPIDADTTLGITCTPGTGYSVSIDGGGSGDPDHRLLRAGQKTVGYGLYQDSGHSQPWGISEGETVSGTGNGAKDAPVVHGRIPPQAAAPGSYSDTVVVTISY